MNGILVFLLFLSILIAICWSTIHRYAGKHGSSAAIWLFQTYSFIYVVLLIASQILAVLAGFIMQPNEPTSMISRIVFVSVSATSMVVSAAIVTVIVLSIELNRAVSHEFQENKIYSSPEAVGIRMWLRRTRFIQTPVFKFFGINTYPEIMNWLAGQENGVLEPEPKK